jgi:hypothetical protein
MELSKALILRSVIGVWVAISVIYIGHDMWKEFRQGQIDKAKQEGRTEVLAELIKAGSQCNPFNVTLNEQSVQLANVECIKRSLEAAGAPQPGPAMAGAQAPGMARPPMNPQPPTAPMPAPRPQH